MEQSTAKTRRRRECGSSPSAPLRSLPARPIEQGHGHIERTRELRVCSHESLEAVTGARPIDDVGHLARDKRRLALSTDVLQGRSRTRLHGNCVEGADTCERAQRFFLKACEAIFRSLCGVRYSQGSESEDLPIWAASIGERLARAA